MVGVGGARWLAATDEGTPVFDTWVLHRGPSLLRCAYLLTRDRGRADGAVHDGLVAAYSRWSRIGVAPDAYVRRCIINADISRWRRFFRRETPVTPSDLPDGVTLRQLTANVLQPILTGIHRPWSYTQTLYELVVGPVPSKGSA